MHEALGHLVTTVNLYHPDRHSNVAIDTLLAGGSFLVFVLLIAGLAEASRLRERRRQANPEDRT